ncbi:MAG: HNH endonuclease family protein, partial [Candidatus Izemoplasmatales bacterium]|nr:HNH endonuclease family protein [Candidatus Izemoplasmatales bacterium]
IHDGEDFFKVARSDGNFFLTQLIDNLDIYRSFDEIQQDFELNFRADDKYNSQLLLCYKFYDSKISDLLNNKKAGKDFLLSLKNKLIGCEVIEISVTDDYDGYRIFETLNARGIPLEQHELIKNYIYSYMRTSAKKEKVTNSWTKLVSNLMRNNTDSFPSFLSHYCTHRFGKIKKSEEFRVIRDKTDKKHVDKLLVSLMKSSEHYMYIEDPKTYKALSNSSEIIFDSLEFFKKLNIRQVRPLLLSLFEKLEGKPSDLRKIETSINYLEKFYFLYVIILKNTTNNIDNTIITLSKELHESVDYDYSIIINKLKSFLPTDHSNIKTDFMKIGFSNKNSKFKNSSNKKTINYILTKIEKSYDFNDELTFSIKSVEHIMGDSPTDDIVSKLGNLLPMSTKLNNKMGNKDFEKKIEYYKKSNLLSVKKFVSEYGSNLTWKEQEINERTEKIVDYALANIWVL